MKRKSHKVEESIFIIHVGILVDQIKFLVLLICILIFMNFRDPVSYV